MKLRSFLQAVPVLFLLLSLAGPAWGAGGTGGGGGPAVPLTMDWNFPADGERNVSLTPIIQCKFSHNVAHSTVQRRNKTLVSLTKADGSPVAYQVYLVDAQIEFSKRQYIYILPTGPLEANTTYTVHVTEGVQAKNGMATEEAQSFSFTTGSGVVPSVPLMVETASPAVSQEPETEAVSDSPEPAVLPSAAVSSTPSASAGPSQTAESAIPSRKVEETAATDPLGAEVLSSEQETAAPGAVTEPMESQPEAEHQPEGSAPSTPVTQAEDGTGWLLPAGFLLAVCLGFAGLYFRKR